jgi:hypothetical protein
LLLLPPAGLEAGCRRRVDHRPSIRLNSRRNNSRVVLAQLAPPGWGWTGDGEGIRRPLDALETFILRLVQTTTPISTSAPINRERRIRIAARQLRASERQSQAVSGGLERIERGAPGG